MTTRIYDASQQVADRIPLGNRGPVTLADSDPGILLVEEVEAMECLERGRRVIDGSGGINKRRKPQRNRRCKVQFRVRSTLEVSEGAFEKTHQGSHEGTWDDPLKCV